MPRIGAPSVSVVAHSGAIVVSGVAGGYLRTRTFYGHTRRDAVRLWRAAVAEELRQG